MNRAMTKDLTALETHFKFGENWRDYSAHIDDQVVASAVRSFQTLVKPEEIAGRGFLDIGSGSGLHSLAAHLSGVGAITAVDIDAESVATTRRMLSERGVDARVEQRSVFDLKGMGEYDVVYSWGVLHHTGAMWRAIDAAAAHVVPGGLFVLALYKKTPMCGVWKAEKRLYTAAPKALQRIWLRMFGTAALIAKSLLGTNPFKYVRNYSSNRGMSYWHDVHDWLGGYPYESCTPAELNAHVCALGFTAVRKANIETGMGILGTGCAEYVFRKTS
jgi:2-polyprenyl-3-methyl-5-hydroxy-6-metoxy-1,4-benzoquinol methylase